MRQTVRVTDKPPWSLGATSREKHCLGADNKLLPCRVIAARASAYPTETSILCHLIAWTARQRQTRDSARCVLLILEFTTSSWFHNVSLCGLAYKPHGQRACHTVRGKCLFMHITSRVYVTFPRLYAQISVYVICRETWCIPFGFA